MMPEDLHRRVQDAFNTGDADALVALYEDDAVMATPEDAGMEFSSRTSEVASA